MHRRARWLLILLASLLPLISSFGWPGLLGTAAPKPCGKPAPYADFNGDGYADILVGIYFENVGGLAGAGAVQIVYGSASGLDPAGVVATQLWTQNSAGLASDGADMLDQFGSALAVGDFNGDGYSDLAVGAPQEDHGILAIFGNAGVVHVLYGSAVGLTTTGNQLWSQDSGGVLDQAETDDLFGQALAAGDFNGDGYHDLAVGAPLETIGVSQEGGVNVFFGSATGLTAAGNQFWTQDTGLIEGIAAGGENFGWALAARDLDANGAADLAVGVPRDITLGIRGGAVNVIYGTVGTGLTDTGNQLWSQDSTGVGDLVEDDDVFGWAVAAGDFNLDGRGDLAVGVPREDLSTRTSSIADAGAVQVLFGSATGLTGSGSQFWTQDALGIMGASQANDQFGFALHAADFNGDAVSDLAAGAPFDDQGSVSDAGAVNVIYGVVGIGLTASGDQRWTQNSGGILEAVQAEDHFGWTVAGDDFNLNGCADLIVGVPDEDFAGPPATTGAGLIHTIYGTGAGLGPAGNQIWSQDSLGLAGDGTSEGGDHFGIGLPSR